WRKMIYLSIQPYCNKKRKLSSKALASCSSKPNCYYKEKSPLTATSINNRQLCDNEENVNGNSKPRPDDSTNQPSTTNMATDRQITTASSFLSTNRLDSHGKHDVRLPEETDDDSKFFKKIYMFWNLWEREIANRTQKILDEPILFFNEKEICLEYIHSHSDKHIFLIISDENVRDFILTVHSLLQIHSVYVYCTEDDFRMLAIWSDAYPKVWGVFSIEERLLNKLVLDLALYWTEKGDEYKKAGVMKLANINYKRSLKLYNTLLD
ncbi:unnamed protein product, partial [Didymodactylos carnosus]